MYGAIIGDLAGSIYEYDEYNDSQNKIINLKRRLEILDKKLIIDKDAFYSDDTILTMAILDSILSNTSYEEKLREYGIKYGSFKLNRDNYFSYMFSPNFTKWCKGLVEGKSNGNGCMMRVSPIAYIFNDLDKIKEHSRLCTIPTHNTNSSIKSAEIVSVVIYLARCGKNKEFIKKYLQKEYNIELNYNLEVLRKTNLFDGTNKVLELCLYILLESNNFVDSIKNAISIGGDTDTIACIVGSMAEALYGIEDELICEATKKIPIEFNEMLVKAYKSNI